MIKLTENGFISLNGSILGNNYILSVLGEPLEIDKNFTLRSFFKIFINYPQLANLEAYLLDYVYLYNTELHNIKENENYNIIKYNSYLVSEPDKVLDIRHNLVVSSRSKHNLRIDRFQIEELLDSKIILSKTIRSYLIVKNSKGETTLTPTQEKFKVLNPCNLYNFILWFSGSLFKGKNPELRRNFVDYSNSANESNTFNLMKEIETLIKD